MMRPQAVLRPEPHRTTGRCRRRAARRPAARTRARRSSSPTGRTPSTTGSTRTTSDGVDAEPLAAVGIRAGRSRHPRGGGRRGASVGVVLAHESAQRAVRQLATEIDTAASRIHSLVAAVKGFTYVNQQATLQPIAIGRGLVRHDDRAAIEGADEVGGRGAAASPSDLPDVEGYGGELNQVWANLLDNAIDAAPQVTCASPPRAPAAPSSCASSTTGRAFPPTSPAASSIRSSPPRTSARARASASTSPAASSMRHHGAIDVSTERRGTEFRVTLPAMVASHWSLTRGETRHPGRRRRPGSARRGRARPAGSATGRRTGCLAARSGRQAARDGAGAEAPRHARCALPGRSAHAGHDRHRVPAARCASCIPMPSGRC